MAHYDWNHDGKMDFRDDFIEYEEFMSDSNYTPKSGGGISTFGAILATVGGLFLAIVILALLGGGENTPASLIIIMWWICGTGLSLWFKK